MAQGDHAARCGVGPWLTVEPQAKTSMKAARRSVGGDRLIMGSRYPVQPTVHGQDGHSLPGSPPSLFITSTTASLLANMLLTIAIRLNRKNSSFPCGTETFLVKHCW